ncbi:putative ferruginol synthase [Helianthus anomalus]
MTLTWATGVRFGRVTRRNERENELYLAANGLRRFGPSSRPKKRLFPLVISILCFFKYFGYFVFGLVFDPFRRNPRLPPGPYPFPIIGNLLLLTNKPHRSLAALSERYGPLMSLKLGSRTTIVVSSPDIAQEFFQKHDQSFSSRSIPETARVMDHHKYSVAWLPAGDEWRKLRRITKECLFSRHCLDGSQQLRRQKVRTS